MTVVVDASVALKWFFDEPDALVARRLLDREDPVVAPELIVAELCNVAWKSVRRGIVAAVQAEEMCGNIAALMDELIEDSQLAVRAFRLSVELDHPAYDCFYLALAEQRDAVLVTADQRLIRKATGTRWAPLVTDLAAA